jgi:membrane protease YdiL (CAAX protease family)
MDANGRAHMTSDDDADPGLEELTPEEIPEPPKPVGWHPDPYEHAAFRWWDGNAWTWQVTQDRRTVSWDAIPTETETEPRPQGLAGLGVGLIGMAFGIGASAGSQALLAALGHPGGAIARIWVGQLTLWSGLVGACIYVSRRRGSGSFSRDFGFRVRWIDIGLGFAGAIAGRLLAVSALVPIAVFIRHLHAPDRPQFDPFAHGAAGWTSLAILVCVGAPIIEELFFRGLVQTRLVTRWGPVTGVAVASLFFGVAHLVGWVGPITLAYAWTVAAGGLALGTMRHLTGRLGTSMFAHCFFNVQALVVVATAARIR